MSIDTRPAKLFFEILASSETNNLSDVVYKKIDTLLSMPVYQELEEYMTVYTKDKKYTGKDAYLFAFKNFNKTQFDMSGGINITWNNFLSNNKKNRTLDFIKNIVNNKSKIIYQTNLYLNGLLPNNLADSQKINVVLCLDGNRGSFESLKFNMVVLDLTDLPNYNITSFTEIVAHESHHVLYGKWLNEHYKPKDQRDSTIYDYQKGIIMEGIAQQINFEDSLDYTPEIKELYFNKQLIEELANEWFNSFKVLSKTKNPLNYYNKFISEMWSTKSIEKLKKYHPGKLNAHLYSRRPTIPYYLGYYLYYSINKNGGTNKLSKAISHPEQLLIIYNHLRKENDLIPTIPADVLKIWHQNLENIACR